MWEFETHVAEIIQRTPNIKTFRFYTVEGSVRYKAGQFFFVTIKIGAEEAQHHFTISSSPTEKGILEFTKRITGSDYSKALDAMQPGAWARLHGPSGDFVLPSRPAKLGFLSGGIGITPLRSMLRCTCDRRLGHDIVLLYANNSWEDIAFREELEYLARVHRGVRIEHVLAGPQLPFGWKGKTGYITSGLVTEVVPDFRDRVFYISGPPRMVFSLEDQLRGLGIPDDRVKRDFFPGYD